ncbi:MAG TPA: SGNH/GDSL hydrolase family protein [Vicinamibacterales bacterium]|nr:SGNH/GDSL hydrolase family protein [Vicinamibacterales bacterium]
MQVRVKLASLMVLVLSGILGAQETPPPPDADSPAAPASGLSTGRIAIGDTETVVFFGDSITEQNLYTAYLETFLLTRLPDRTLAFFNFGWGGDTASGGNARFARDVAPVKPTLVFVNFGMNDGGYRAFDEQTYRLYMDSQAALADTIKAAGARQVLFTTSPVDDVLRGDKGVYNETLSRMAKGVAALGRERQLPVIDLFNPMLDVQRRAKQRDAGFTMIPDTIHPDPVGHLVMAYIALRRIDAPRSVGEITIDGTRVTARGLRIDGLIEGDGLVQFDLTLPFLPFYVPEDARAALELVPFQSELNGFTLRGTPPADEPIVLSVDGVIAGVFAAPALARGVDLALLDKTPWARAGRLLWETAQFRWDKHFEAWRRMGLDRPARMMPELPSFEPLVRAQRAYADDLGRSLQKLARPGTYRVTLAVPGGRVPIESLDISPTYPLDALDTAYPPEKDSASVPWSNVPLAKGQVDLGAHFSGARDVVSYARLVLEAEGAAVVHLSLGSDDGLAVFLDGERVFARDVRRPLRPGEDELDLSLAPGRHELLFKVTQAGGGYGLAVEAQVLGRAKVRQVPPS